MFVAMATVASGALVAAAASAAHAAVFSESLAAGDESGDESKEQARRLESRLETILDVNRKLHEALAEKRRFLEEGRRHSTFMQNRCIGAAVADRARVEQVLSLQEGNRPPSALKSSAAPSPRSAGGSKDAAVFPVGGAAGNSDGEGSDGVRGTAANADDEFSEAPSGEAPMGSVVLSLGLVKAPPSAMPKYLVREGALFRQRKAKLEDRIVAMNAENLELSQRHQHGQERLVTGQSKLRTLAKREKELSRALEFLAEQFGQASNQFRPPPGSQGLPVVDYRNLPGVGPLGKLVGKPAPRMPPRPEAPHPSSPCASTSAAAQGDAGGMVPVPPQGARPASTGRRPPSVGHRPVSRGNSPAMR